MTTDYRVLVFGATGGVGSALARELTRRGFRLALSGRRTEILSALSRELDAPAFAGDASRSDDVEMVFRKVAETLGPLNAVAHCVGSLVLKPAHLTTDDDWLRLLSVNLTSAFHVVREAARALGKTGGSVALVSSAAASRGLANHEAIAAAKAGLEGLTRSAAATYARQGIRFNAVAPGLVDTPLAAGITGHEASRRYSEGLHALGRLGRPEEIASAIAWLISPEQTWVTGQVLGVDGGLGTVQAR